MQIKHPAAFASGYEPIVGRAGPASDMLMDFGIVSLDAGQSWESAPGMERAILLMSGDAKFSWGEPGTSGVVGADPAGSCATGTASAWNQAEVSRSSLFDENPTVLHLDKRMVVRITAGVRSAELCVTMTENETGFPAKFYLPVECRSEERGKGTMHEASTRIVRTVFDDSNAPHSNLVIGEVVGVPGKWSSYPPHHHPQPEIYHYRFLPGQGFGLTAIGDRAYMLTDRDTILIRDTEDHPQVTAPGYAMWYLWVIRHLDGDRYITPTFTEAHTWVTAQNADIWLPPSGRT